MRSGGSASKPAKNRLNERCRFTTSLRAKKTSRLSRIQSLFYVRTIWGGAASSAALHHQKRHMAHARSQYFAQRKRECEQLLKAIDARKIRLTEEHTGWRRDLTDEYRRQLEAHCEAYQKVIELIEAPP